MDSFCLMTTLVTVMNWWRATVVRLSAKMQIVTQARKKEEKFLEFIWRGMTPSTWRCHGWEKELHPRGVRFSPWLCGGRRCCFGSPCGSWSIGIRGCGDVFFHLQAAVWGQDTSHVYAWPVVILVRRLCCGVDRFSCWSMSPTPEVFLEVFLSHTAVTCVLKLQTLVYDILPSTTAIFSYAIGSRKLSANEQFFVGAQTVVNLLQTAQIISDVCFITDHVAYASSNQTKIILIKTVLFFLPGVDAPHVYVRAWALGCFHSLISTEIFRRALTTSVADSYAEIKSSVTKFGSLEEGAGSDAGVCPWPSPDTAI